MKHTVLQMEQHLKGQNIGGRRAVPRFDASVIPTLKSINRVGGPKVELINISRRGALIESREHMSSGSSISLRFVTTETAYVIKGRITRCSTSLTKKKSFQSAIAFDKDFTFLPTCIHLLED